MTTTAGQTSAGTAAGGGSRQGRNLMRGVAMLALSGALLTLSFPKFNVWVLSLVALVPFVVCVLRRPMTWRWVGVYYLFGSLWYLANLVWLFPVTGAGTVALCFYVGVYWALFAWGLHRLVVHLRWPAMAAAPLMWVTCEYLLATVMTGFPWYLLGNAVGGSDTLRQVADLAGVWGLSFFAAMTACWLVDLIRLPLVKDTGGRRGANPTLVTLSAVYLLTAAFVVGYGIFRLNQSTMTPGPMVGVVQEYIPQSLRDSAKNVEKREVFDRHYAITRDLLRSTPGLDLVVWPETMTVDPVNPEWLNIDTRILADDPYWLDALSNSHRVHAVLGQLAQAHKVNLLVGSPLLAARQDRTGAVSEFRQNVALLYGPDGRQSDTVYAKRHLVPFGEYVPFRESAPWLHRMLMYLTPYGPDGDYSNTPGREWTRFEFTPQEGGQTYRFGVPICYEDVMPYPSRGFVHPSGGAKRIDFLISITNDGWYESVNQLDQHLRMGQIRAVENRVPFVRSVNGGNSGFIDANGRVVKLVMRDGQSTFVAGSASWTLMLDSRVTLFSRVGDLLPVLCGIAAALAVAWTILRPRRAAKREAA